MVLCCSQMETVGQRIRIARLTAGISQEALAEKLGFSDRQMVSRYEGDKVVPPIPRLQEIADMTDRPLYWFFLGPLGVYMNYGPDLQDEFCRYAKQKDQELKLRAEHDPEKHAWTPGEKPRHSSGLPLDKCSDEEAQFIDLGIGQQEQILDWEEREMAKLAGEDLLTPKLTIVAKGGGTLDYAKILERLNNLEEVVSSITFRSKAGFQLKAKSPTSRATDDGKPDKGKAGVGDLKHPLAADGGSSKGDAKKAEERARKLLEEQ